jgi:hypothetical protein
MFVQIVEQIVARFTPFAWCKEQANGCAKSGCAYHG